MSFMFRLALVLLVLFPALSLRAGIVDTDVVINEAFYLGDATQDWVELKNTGRDTINVANWWLCSEFVYARLSTLPILDGDDFMLDAGEILTVGATIDLNDTAADLGLYNTNDFGEATAMVDFLQWGTSGLVGRSAVAETKRAWREYLPGLYDFVATAAAGESVAYCGANSGVPSEANGALLTLSEDLENGTATRGAENGLSCSLLFADGFESGDTTTWTLTVPLTEDSLLDVMALQ